MSLTFTDLFCGAGGSSTGLVAAGLELRLAANHWKRAVETHAANHRDADHLCADINNYDMRRLPRTDILWASPICTEISPAGGRRRTHGQLSFDLEEHGRVDDAGWERTRATAYDVIRATEVHRYKAVLCENVLEFAVDWELFDWWRKGMEMLGYRSQIVSVSSAHVGGTGNLPAPQWRDRIYIVFTRTDIPQPDLAPTPLAYCTECETDVRAVQSWRNGRRVGKYKQQYDYRCPNTACRHAVVEPYVRPAASIIDWTNLGVRIGDRPATGLRPLAANTVKRIRAGLNLLGDQRMVLTVNHGGHDGRAVPADTAPLAARTVKIGDAVLVPSGGTWNTTPTGVSEPMRTRLANPKGFEALLTPPQADDSFIVTLRRNATARPVGEPVDTVTAKGRHHWLVIPYRNAATKTTGEPLHTLSTVDSAGIASPAPALEDCHYRMIQPREQLLAQRFPADYIVHGNKGEQTMQAGNAVSCNVAQWIGERVTAALARTAAHAA
ncbi:MULTISPECIES: DNA cytosine methyltransferase [unclassified Streptomyces]|uniref:DNA cytosine methyltransferase n=1 Tax=unclassified Streptomyces TaxID=2593676 RepID=UPI0007484D1C|nr:MULTISPECIES: DNA cytosine methyltransferase [unclassified Streptomyces]KUL51664.1 DNA methyltransferase [Streptomyces sp. NRRL S-1521]THC52361.1 DNA cytosine methyltransferase [Streptomyces sp. A1499]